MYTYTDYLFVAAMSSAHAFPSNEMLFNRSILQTIGKVIDIYCLSTNTNNIHAYIFIASQFTSANTDKKAKV